MGETRDRIEEGLKAKVQEDVQKSLQEQLENVLAFLIPEIMQDILLCRVDPQRLRPNFYIKHQHLDPKMICAAVNIAEATALRLGNFYIDEFLGRAEDTVTWDANNEYSSESSIEYPDSDEFLAI